ncbi:type II toxin-antitoxin system Phd/YefM family antitoxin [Tessaracoccus massiliensis]|uniref:type II toxin-antitoxin system Phd/YefM family antitoxin n=1 Tax=Tessaracoccus massiliensis TaxID=1522311 RepID=UPI000590EFC6|nr:type II toxin-antitoxin system prevent-host-death family antitoxin [Tessaracoccus massiliensis]
MGRVTVRDLRNRSADVLARVAGGETLTITRDGEPVAEVVPLPRRRLNAEELTARWRNVPQIDANALRAEIDSLLDPSL